MFHFETIQAHKRQPQTNISQTINQQHTIETSHYPILTTMLLKNIQVTFLYQQKNNGSEKGKVTATALNNTLHATVIAKRKPVVKGRNTLNITRYFLYL